MGLLQRLKERREKKRELVARLKEVERDIDIETVRGKVKTTVNKIRRRGFFSKERVAQRQGRIAKRRDFRVAVSGNRKWMLIGLAAVVICITIIYLSVTYGGGILKFF